MKTIMTRTYECSDGIVFADRLDAAKHEAMIELTKLLSPYCPYSAIHALLHVENLSTIIDVLRDLAHEREDDKSRSDRKPISPPFDKPPS